MEPTADCRQPLHRRLRRVRIAGLALVALLAPTACGGGRDEPAPLARAAGDTAAERDLPEPTPTTTTAAAPSSPVMPAPPPPTAAAPPPSDPSGPGPAGGFTSRVEPIGDAVRARMASSWRPGCPVPLEDLRLLTLRHWGFDGVEHDGELVVHADQAEAVVTVFAAVHRARFPIERMELVDVYGADDDASMAANNTSAFNCREVAGRPGRWSQHAYGRAIDINPLQNPYVRGTSIDPPGGAPFADRSVEHPGLITADGPAVAAFRSVGWAWGGAWASGQDYQHFSASGR